MQKLHWKHWQNALGIRHDEKHRAKTDFRDGFYPFYPLVNNKVTLFDIETFWNKQNFKLNLPIVKGKTLMGNCDLCFLKSEAQLAMMMKQYPEKSKWWIDMELQTGKQFNRDRNLKEMNKFVNQQQDWVFDQQGYFCQANSGECTG